MGYRNAQEIFPEDLLKQIQRPSPALFFSRFSTRSAVSLGFMEDPPSVPDPVRNEYGDCQGWQSGLDR